MKERQCPGVSKGPAGLKLQVTLVAHAMQCDKVLENLKRGIFVPGMRKRGSTRGRDGRGMVVPELAAVLLEHVSWATSPASQFHVGLLP